MGTKETLTIQELEQLSQAYIDCRLSILQERDLELVLLSCDESSPIIDEARYLMGITTRMAIISANEGARKKKIRSIFIKFAGIAAAVGAIIIYSIGLFRSDVTTNNSSEIYVCVDGEILSGEKAQTIMNETEHLSMEMLNSTIEEVENDLRSNTESMISIMHDNL